MSVSILRARVVLDRPYYAYTGTAEPVTGNILIKHTPQIKHMAADAELFGPLIINATFSGQISTMLCRNDKIPYSSKTPLFCITSVIYDGPFKASPDEDNKFPFSFNFPEKAEPRKHPLFRGNVEPDSMATGVNGALPPSFRINYLGFEDQIDGSVEYRVRCEVEMPGIAIEVAGLEFAPEVRYERSRIPIASAKRDTTTRNQPVRIRTSKLFSPDDQPHGFRQKSKALFRSSDKLPCWAFDVSCTSPTDVYKGEGLAFDVRLNIIEAECTVPVAPVITLEKFSVRALTSSTVSAEGQTLTSSDSPDSNVSLLRPERVLVYCRSKPRVVGYINHCFC